MKKTKLRTCFQSLFLIFSCAATFAANAADDSVSSLGSASSTGQQQYTSGFGIEIQSATAGADVDTVLNTDDIHVVGRIQPQPDHIGKQADIFIVDSLDNGLVMKTADGGFTAWSGAAAELEPAMTNVVLTENMNVDVHSGVIDYVGHHNLYLGYRLADDPALIYNAIPVTLQVVPDEPAENRAAAGEALALTTTSTTTTTVPTMTLSKYSTTSGTSVTMWWGKGVAPCTASASPAYAPFSGSVKGAGKLVIPASVTTTFTLTCANGSKSRTLTVSGSTTTPPPDGGGGTPLPNPLNRTVAPISTSALDVAIMNFSHTANREWNYGGHNVPVPFSTNSGYWEYSDSHVAAWLFDRPTSWYQLYALTNNAAHKANAIRDTEWYASRINSSGYFIPKVLAGENDTKYGYVTPFLWYERLTGDTKYRPVAQRIYLASLKGYSTAYPLGSGMWTEREAGIHGEAALSYYEITKDTAALNEAGLIIKQVGQLAAANGGAPQVTYYKHEGGGASSLTNSPWMTALYFQFARRYYEVTGDQDVLRQASAYFDWLDVNGLYDGSEFSSSWAGITVPRYLTGPETGDAYMKQSDTMHCLDVAGTVAFALDAKKKLGLSTTKAAARLDQLKTCALKTFNYWTRITTTLPKYRTQPPRAWMWWMRGRYEFLP